MSQTQLEALLRKPACFHKHFYYLSHILGSFARDRECSVLDFLFQYTRQQQQTTFTDSASQSSRKQDIEGNI